MGFCSNCGSKFKLKDVRCPGCGNSVVYDPASYASRRQYYKDKYIGLCLVWITIILVCIGAIAVFVYEEDYALPILGGTFVVLALIVIFASIASHSSKIKTLQYYYDVAIRGAESEKPSLKPISDKPRTSGKVPEELEISVEDPVTLPEPVPDKTEIVFYTRTNIFFKGDWPCGCCDLVNDHHDNVCVLCGCTRR